MLTTAVKLFVDEGKVVVLTVAGTSVVVFNFGLVVVALVTSAVVAFVTFCVVVGSDVVVGGDVVFVLVDGLVCVVCTVVTVVFGLGVVVGITGLLVILTVLILLVDVIVVLGMGVVRAAVVVVGSLSERKRAQRLPNGKD